MRLDGMVKVSTTKAKKFSIINHSGRHETGGNRMKPLTQRFTAITLVPEGEPIFHERGYTISIDDEGAGEFVVVRENDAAVTGGIRIDPKDWFVLREAIEWMVNHTKETPE